MNTDISHFDVTKYLSKSKGYSRIDMPQIEMSQFVESLDELRKYFRIFEVKQPAMVLLPTQNEINMDKVVKNMSTYGEVDDSHLVFICSNDNYFVDGHHRHVQQLISDKFKAVKCYVFADLDIDSLMLALKRFSNLLMPSKSITESILSRFGSDKLLHAYEMLRLNDDCNLNESHLQHIVSNTPIICSAMTPEQAIAIKQMIKNSFGVDMNITHVDENAKTIEAITDDKDNVQEKPDKSNVKTENSTKTKDDNGNEAEPKKKLNQNIMTVSQLLKYNEKNSTNEDFGMQGPEAVPGMGAVSFPSGDTKGSGDFMHSGAKIFVNDDEHAEELRKAYALLKESMHNAEINEEVVDKCEVHFDNARNIDDLKQCQTRPTLRKCKQIDTEFSCNTLEGITKGKAGDYLVVGTDQEIYPVDQEIFNKTYEIL